MRRHGFVLICTLVLASVAATAAQAHSTPQIRAERAHERAVLAEYNKIGRNLQIVEDAASRAHYLLVQTNLSLHKNEHALRLARQNLGVARKRLMARLYSLYVNGQPSTLDVIAGADSISQLIDRAESANVLTSQDAALGKQALRYARTVQHKERQLHQLKRKRTQVVARLASRQRVVQATLEHEKRLLASIHTTIRQLVAKEAAHEEALRKAEEARVAREIAAQQAAAARQQQQSPSTTGLTGPPVDVPIGNSGVGHPQAAQIALRYLGVPYVWGGASPSGFDCSGLVMYVYAQLGISLPHYTVSQWDATLPISPSQMQPGDLVFFDGLGHVGIYLGNGQFIDAPHTGAVVRIDSLAGWGGSFDGARRVP